VPKPYSSRDIVKALEKQGFKFVGQTGSHAKYRKAGKSTLTVIVPAGKKEIPIGTLRSILRQARMTRENLEDRRAA